jgi:hypothetical protein
MPQEINEVAMRKMSDIRLPSAKPPDMDEQTKEEIPGQVIPGTLPHREIAHQEYPRLVYKHPAKPYRRVMVMIDGHGNKEWKWQANEAKHLLVKNKAEFDAALKQGYQAKHYVAPPPPVEDAEEELSPAK